MEKQEEIVHKNYDVLTRQSDRMEKEIIKVKESGQGRVGQIFKMKEVVGGSTKLSIEPHAIKDPNTQELFVANNDIKRATLKYCVANLQKKDPDPQVKSLVELKKILVEEKMKENSGETLDISKDDFKVVTTKFKLKQTKSYDFLIKSGNKYQDAIYNICKKK